eukprot:COSAG06_NODE_1473_length_9344_cov_34.708599_6_plen_162_part_00
MARARRSMAIERPHRRLSVAGVGGRSTSPTASTAPGSAQPHSAQHPGRGQHDPHRLSQRAPAGQQHVLRISAAFAAKVHATTPRQSPETTFGSVGEVWLPPRPRDFCSVRAPTADAANSSEGSTAAGASRSRLDSEEIAPDHARSRRGLAAHDGVEGSCNR